MMVRKTTDVELGIRVKKEEKERKFSSASRSTLVESKGDDFLFLFDLVACTCGKAATLRVLSYTAPSFEKLCQPRIQNNKTTKTETSLKIQWLPARLQDIRSYDKLEVAEYIATIFPGYDWKSLSENSREAEFKHLAGGTTQYTITVSAIVGQAKMKGVTIKAYLPPFPPQSLQCYPSECMANKTTSIKISWTTPRGDFHKYSLRIALLDAKTILRNSLTGDNLLVRNTSKKLPDEIWLPRDANEHIAENLQPGEKYQIELKSMTDFQKCLDEKAPKVVVLTKPLPPSNIQIQESFDQASVEWSPPEGCGHSCLVGYKIQLRIKSDGKLIKDEFVSTLRPRLITFEEIFSTMEYEITCASVCRNNYILSSGIMNQPTEIHSDSVTRSFVAPPRPPLNIRLESSQPTSLRIKWDPPLDCNTKPTFNISLRPLNPEVQKSLVEDMVKETETNVFTFSKLPDVVGTGKIYEVSVKTVINVGGKFYHSAPAKKAFMTKPLPPENLSVLNSKCQEFSWIVSKTAGVKRYKFKIKKEEEKAIDFIIDDNTIQEESFDESQEIEAQKLTFKVPLKFEEGIEYKINLYSLVEFEGNWIESEPHHVKVTKEYENSEVITESPNSIKRRRSILTLIRNQPNVRNGRRQSTFNLPAYTRQNTFEFPNTYHGGTLDIPILDIPNPDDNPSFRGPLALDTANHQNAIENTMFVRQLNIPITNRRKSETQVLPLQRFNTSCKYKRSPTSSIIEGSVGKLF